MTVDIRPAAEHDLAAICAIECASFTVAWTRHDFDALLDHPSGNILVATAGGTILGFGCIATVPPEGEIMNIAVAPEHRRLGIGQILLSAMLTSAEMSGVEDIFLEVRESNDAARTLYEKNGFQAIGVRKNYYTKPTENAIVMRKILSKRTP